MIGDRVDGSSQAMNFMDCYLCGELAVQERVSRDLTATIFCTNRQCGRYDIVHGAAQALRNGTSFKDNDQDILTRVYLANRTDERVLISLDDLNF
jgi:hypothetical protein